MKDLVRWDAAAVPRPVAKAADPEPEIEVWDWHGPELVPRDRPLLLDLLLRQHAVLLEEGHRRLRAFGNRLEDCCLEVRRCQGAHVLVQSLLRPSFLTFSS